MPDNVHGLALNER